LLWLHWSQDPESAQSNSDLLNEYLVKKMTHGIRLFFEKHTWAGAIIYFFILTLIMTWPLVLKMSDQIVGQVGDNIYFIWMIGWVQKALFELGVNPFNVWFLNYPEGWSLAYTEITPIQIAMALPFSQIGGATFAYNAVMMLTFILAGLGMYLWIYRVTGSIVPALIAGTLFAFTPYHFAHFRIGHLNLSGIQWFPFFFMGFFDILDRRDFNWKNSLLAGIMLGFIALTSQYYLYMTLLVSGFIALITIVFYRRGLLKSPQFWKNVVVFAGVSLPVIILAIAPYISLQRQGGLPDRNISIVRPYSASPTDFILPSTDHFLWGQWIGNHFNRDMWVEGTLYLGVVAIALALIGFVKGLQGGHKLLLGGLLWGSLFSLILAMGIDLHWNGSSVVINLPEFLKILLGRSEAPLPLPGYLFFYTVPYFAKLRALMRFGIFTILFVSAAAGFGAAKLFEYTPQAKKSLLTIVLFALMFIDIYPGPYSELSGIKARQVDYWLKEQTATGALVQMPFRLAEDQEQTYYTLTHGKPYIGGFFNAFPPAQYARISPILEGFPDEASVDLLRQLGVRYVLIELDEYPDLGGVREKIEGLGMVFMNEVDGQLVYELK